MPAASLARKVYMKQGLGVGALRRQYGGRNKRKGVVPEHFCRASGGLIRHILIQLETLGFVEKHTGSHGGRRITSQVRAAPRRASLLVPHLHPRVVLTDLFTKAPSLFMQLSRQLCCGWSCVLLMERPGLASLLLSTRCHVSSCSGTM